MRLHLHLLSDSTGETLDTIAKAGISQFDGVDTIKHFWPMVRSAGHLDRVLNEIVQRPGLIIYTLVNLEVRHLLESRCRMAGLPHVAPLDPVFDALQRLLGQEAKARPGRQPTAATRSPTFRWWWKARRRRTCSRSPSRWWWG